MRAILFIAFVALSVAACSGEGTSVSVPAATEEPQPTVDPEEGHTLTEEELLRLNERVCPLDGRIAYTTSKDGNSEVYVRNADGSGEINLSNQLTNDTDPVWSPDCKWIAYSSDRNWFPENTWEIFVTASDGSGEYLLLPAADDRCCQDYAKAWSPDGGLIAFTGGAYGHHLYLVEPDGSGLRWLASGARPTWSPDSKQIFYIAPFGNTPRDSYVINVDGTGNTLVAPGEVAPDTCFEEVLSPDRKKVACMSVRQGWNQEIYVMDADGSGMINVTDSPAAESEPAWAPDSHRLAFASNRNGVFEIFTVGADGSGLKQVTSARCSLPCSGDQAPRWSDNGRLIYFIYAPQDVDIPCEVRPDGSGLKCTPPTPVPSDCVPVEMTPDGRIIRCR